MDGFGEKPSRTHAGSLAPSLSRILEGLRGKVLAASIWPLRPPLRPPTACLLTVPLGHHDWGHLRGPHASPSMLPVQLCCFSLAWTPVLSAESPAVLPLRLPACWQVDTADPRGTRLWALNSQFWGPVPVSPISPKAWHCLCTTSGSAVWARSWSQCPHGWCGQGAGRSVGPCLSDSYGHWGGI